MEGRHSSQHRWRVALISFVFVLSCGLVFGQPRDRLTPEVHQEIRKTLDTVRTGGQQYQRDGIEFRNREGHLPSKPSGYYREYTVTTPGASNRGERRIVTGLGGETYYTNSHYRPTSGSPAFVRINDYNARSNFSQHDNYRASQTRDYSSPSSSSNYSRVNESRPGGVELSAIPLDDAFGEVKSVKLEGSHLVFDDGSTFEHGCTKDELEVLLAAAHQTAQIVISCDQNSCWGTGLPATPAGRAVLKDIQRADLDSGEIVYGRRYDTRGLTELDVPGYSNPVVAWSSELSKFSRDRMRRLLSGGYWTYLHITTRTGAGARFARNAGSIAVSGRLFEVDAQREVMRWDGRKVYSSSAGDEPIPEERAALDFEERYASYAARLPKLAKLKTLAATFGLLRTLVTKGRVRWEQFPSVTTTVKKSRLETEYTDGLVAYSQDSPYMEQIRANGEWHAGCPESAIACAVDRCKAQLVVFDSEPPANVPARERQMGRAWLQTCARDFDGALTTLETLGGESLTVHEQLRVKRLEQDVFAALTIGGHRLGGSLAAVEELARKARVNSALTTVALARKHEDWHTLAELYYAGGVNLSTRSISFASTQEEFKKNHPGLLEAYTDSCVSSAIEAQTDRADRAHDFIDRLAVAAMSNEQTPASVPRATTLWCATALYAYLSLGDTVSRRTAWLNVPGSVDVHVYLSWVYKYVDDTLYRATLPGIYPLAARTDAYVRYKAAAKLAQLSSADSTERTRWIRRSSEAKAQLCAFGNRAPTHLAGRPIPNTFQQAYDRTCADLATQLGIH